MSFQYLCSFKLSECEITFLTTHTGLRVNGIGKTECVRAYRPLNRLYIEGQRYGIENSHGLSQFTPKFYSIIFWLYSEGRSSYSNMCCSLRIPSLKSIISKQCHGTIIPLSSNAHSWPTLIHKLHTLQAIGMELNYSWLIKSFTKWILCSEKCIKTSLTKALWELWVAKVINALWGTKFFQWHLRVCT